MSEARQRFSILLATGIAAFAILTAGVMAGWLDALDAWALRGFALWAREHTMLIDVMQAATFFGDAPVRLVITAVAALALMWRRRLRGALFLTVTVPGAWIASTLLKHVIARPRPSLLPRLDLVNTHSYPSGHAWSGMVLCLALACAFMPLVPARGRAGLLLAALLGAFLIGVSRIALAVHWPSDVLAGWIGGAIWVALCSRALLVDSDCYALASKRYRL